MVKAAKSPGAQVVTGNRLRDGAVIYLTADDQWSTRIGESAVAHTADAAERLMGVANQAVTDRVVVGPYLIAVALDEKGIQPLGTREKIRASGPSIDAPQSERLLA